MLLQLLLNFIIHKTVLFTDMKKYVFYIPVLTLLVLSSSPALAEESCAQSLFTFNSSKSAAHVIISDQDELVPEWKKIWDQARELTAGQKYVQARIQYELLLTQKDNIDQARWEYVTVLMCLKQWQKAQAEITGLLSHDPDRLEYQLAAAEIALGSGDYPGAVSLFGPLYEQQCRMSHCAGDKIRILSGYVDALEGMGRFSALIPLMEQYVALQPTNFALQKRFAAIALKDNQPDRALMLLRKLQQATPSDYTVFQELAKLYNNLGNTEAAAICQQQVVGLDPGNIAAHEQLISYYRRHGNAAMELKHTEALLAAGQDKEELLKLAARLNVVLQRPDRALEYYNILLALDAGNKEIRRYKDAALHALAEQLLTLVENSGSTMLWQDLVQVTEDRIGVYRALADILRAQGRRSELIEVLLVIRHEVTDDPGIQKELNMLLKEQGRGNIFAARETGSTEPVILSR